MNKLTDIIKRYGIIGCLYKTIFKVVRMLGITYIKYLAYFKELPETIDTDTLVQYHKMTMDDFRKQMKFDGKWFNNRKLKQIERFIDQPGYSYYGIYDGYKPDMLWRNLNKSRQLHKQKDGSEYSLSV